MATWDYYKIAEGPLDIVGKTLKVLTSESDVPIETNNWRDNGDYWELRVGGDGESLCVLDNVNLDNNYDTNGTLPLSGIFVSANIRSISISEYEDVHKIEPNYLTSCTVIPFTKDGNGNITCDLSTEEFISILRNANQPSDVCPALNGVLGIPGYSRYRNVNDNTISFVFAFQNFGEDAGRLRIDDGGADPKTITSLSTFNLGYTLLFFNQDGSVREEAGGYTVPLWTVPLD